MKVLLIIWAIGFAITFPIALSLCRAFKLADEAEGKLNNKINEGKENSDMQKP